MTGRDERRTGQTKRQVRFISDNLNKDVHANSRDSPSTFNFRSLLK